MTYNPDDVQRHPLYDLDHPAPLDELARARDWLRGVLPRESVLLITDIGSGFGDQDDSIYICRADHPEHDLTKQIAPILKDYKLGNRDALMLPPNVSGASQDFRYQILVSEIGRAVWQDASAYHYVSE